MQHHLRVVQMKTSDRGIAALKQRERCRLSAYQDVAGVWTIGYGQTGPNIRPHTFWTHEQAEEALTAALIPREAAILTNVKVPLSQNQFDSLVSFVYNVGIRAFLRSTLLQILNRGNYAGTAKQFAVWNKITDPVTHELVVSNGLTNRRRSEALQFTTPYPQPPKVQP